MRKSLTILIFRGALGAFSNWKGWFDGYIDSTFFIFIFFFYVVSQLVSASYESGITEG